MKNVLLIAALIFTSQLLSQDIGLKFEYLGEESETRMTLISANLETKMETTDEGLRGTVQMYVIQRKQDPSSADIIEAMLNIEGFHHVQLIIRMTNGNKIIHDLENVIIRNYKAKNVAGQDPTEQFELYFESVETTYQN